MHRAHGLRRQTGAQVAEFGPTLWLVFVIIGFPLLTLGTIGLRYTFLVNAARLAATSASQAKSYEADVDVADPSAVHIAQSVIGQSQSAFRGMSISNVTTSIVVCNYSTGAMTTQQAPLTTPANPSTNAYDCQVLVQGTVEPLIPVAGGVLGSIPGLGAPINTQARATVMFENTQGLNQ